MTVQGERRLLIRSEALTVRPPDPGDLPAIYDLLVEDSGGFLGPFRGLTPSVQEAAAALSSVRLFICSLGTESVPCGVMYVYGEDPGDIRASIGAIFRDSARSSGLPMKFIGLLLLYLFEAERRTTVLAEVGGPNSKQLSRVMRRVAEENVRIPERFFSRGAVHESVIYRFKWEAGVVPLLKRFCPSAEVLAVVDGVRDPVRVADVASL